MNRDEFDYMGVLQNAVRKINQICGAIRHEFVRLF
jgi:hypothetical protein